MVRLFSDVQIFCQVADAASGAGAVVTGLMVALSTQVGRVVVVSLMLRVLQVVMVSGESMSWYYLPCGIVPSCQGWDLKKIEVL